MHIHKRKHCANQPSLHYLFIYLFINNSNTDPGSVCTLCLLLISVSRESLRSRKRSDYNLNRANAPILTNTTLNVIRLVGE